jgi:hypothetical protein
MLESISEQLKECDDVIAGYRTDFSPAFERSLVSGIARQLTEMTIPLVEESSYKPTCCSTVVYSPRYIRGGITLSSLEDVIRCLETIPKHQNEPMTIHGCL